MNPEQVHRWFPSIVGIGALLIVGFFSFIRWTEDWANGAPLLPPRFTAWVLTWAARLRLAKIVVKVFGK